MHNDKALLETARKETGLSDFGDDSFREGLERLVNALNCEARLNALGEGYLQNRIISHLKQRLQIEDWYRRHPEIDDVELSAPLIGISLPRTGSTVLSFLLAQDPNARTLRSNEASEPCPPPALRANEEDLDLEAAQRSATGMKSHVPTAKNGPAECQDLMALDFKSQIFLAFAQIPSYAQWLLNADLGSTYHYQRRALKILQWQMPNKPWRLKCPTHLLYLDHLNSAFPDARFVMTHRDPSEVMVSVSSVYTDIATRFSDHIDPQYMGELNVRQWSVGMQRALAFRDAGNEQRFFDIHFRSMHKDPILEVRKLYDWLGETLSPEFEQGMSKWWQQNANSREPAPDKKAEDFGLNLSQIQALFVDYIARMPNVD